MEVQAMKIGLGCDHGGYNLKEEIKKYLNVVGLDYITKKKF